MDIQKPRRTKLKEFTKTLTPDQYTTTLGSYCQWKMNVDLGPWNNSIPTPPEDQTILNYYNALQYTLSETNYPETEDRTMCPRQLPSESQVSIAILSSPVECMAILLEGARQCPGDMLLILSTTWLRKQRSPHDPNLYSLFVHKAITFDSAGRTFLDVFDPPRKVTYFVNFFTAGCTDGQRSDGGAIERELDCPMSDSLNLVSVVDDKVFTRLLMAKAGMKYPETLAFTYGICHRYPEIQFDDITIVTLESTTGMANLVKNEVCRYLQRVKTNIKKVVVKPSGVMVHGSIGVTYHSVNNDDDIVKAVLSLMQNMSKNNSVLIEGFYEPYTKGFDVSDLSFRLRSTVCRGLGNQPITTTLISGMGKKNEPINGDNTQPQSLGTTLQILGLSEHTDRLTNEVRITSERVMQELIEFEETMTLDEKGEFGAQTDLIGIDFVIGVKDNQISPIGIEVNSHDCTINCQLYEFINPHLTGSSVQPLVETMISRSQEYLLKDRIIVVLGSGGTSKRFIWPDSQSYGVKVVLVDAENCDTVAREQCYMFIPYDFAEHCDDIRHANAITDILKKLGLSIDGCCTFWEDCVPLAAMVCHNLGLTGTGIEGAVTAKQKSKTQHTLIQRTGDIPHFPRTYLYAAKSEVIESKEDIGEYLPSFQMPCMLKLEYGSSAVGIKLVHSVEDCEKEYIRIQNKLRTESDHPGIGLGYGNKMFLMEYHSGTEHDVDIIIYNRKLIAAYLSDNGPTKSDSFTETTASMPSSLQWDKQGQLITLAYQCCTEIGLTNGVFNVEVISKPTGPKLVEINARMGGFYIRDWVQRCYGVDLMKISYLISCGIKPLLPKPKHNCHIMGTMCVPSIHGDLFNDGTITNKITAFSEKYEIRYNPIEVEFEKNLEADLEEPICNIAVVEKSREDARQSLLTICKATGIHNEGFDVQRYTDVFFKK